MKNFRQRLLFGLAYLLPFAVLLIILREILRFAKGVTAPILPYFSSLIFGGVGAATLLAVVFIGLLCWIASALALTARGRRVEAWLEHYLLLFIPGYPMMRTLLYDIAGRQESAAITPVLARIEDSWQWGYIMEVVEEGLFAVFVPDVPSPTSGALYFMTEDRIQRIPVASQKIFKNLRRFGIGSRDILQGKVRPFIDKTP